MGNKSRLSLVPDHAALLGYGVIGHETYHKKDYYVACGLFDTALDALTFRGAAKDLHNYGAWEQYFAVAIYADGSLYELHYTYSANRYEEADHRLQTQHPKLGRDFFDCLLKQSLTH